MILFNKRRFSLQSAARLGWTCPENLRFLDEWANDQWPRQIIEPEQPSRAAGYVHPGLTGTAMPHNFLFQLGIVLNALGWLALYILLI